MRAMLLFLVLSLAAVPSSAQLSKDQQNCLNAMNKTFAGIVKAQHLDMEQCVKDGAAGKLDGSVDDCTLADRKGKVQKAKDKASKDWDKKCVGKGVDGTITSLFGSDLPGVVQAEGMDKERRLMEAFFGSELDGLVRPMADKDAAKCQQMVLKELFKCQDTKLKEFLACKKGGLKDGSIVDAATLADACLTNGAAAGQPDPKGKIAKACREKLDKTVQKQCTDKLLDVRDLFTRDSVNTSACDGALSLNAFVDCLERFVECDVCSSINAIDGASRDCDLFDDAKPNQSCGACRNAADQEEVMRVQEELAIVCIGECAPLGVGTPGFNACVQTCIAERASFATQDCSDCFSTVVPCATSNCLQPCLDPESDACLICLEESGCLDCFGQTP